MVDAVVSFVVQRLGDLLIEQVVFLRGVTDEVQWLKKKLEWMLCFLKDAEEKQDGDNRMRQWLSDIRDVAYDAEDIIDNFILNVEEGGTSKKMGLQDCLEKYFCICSRQASLNKQANLYGIGKEINTLKDRLGEIKRNRKNFNIRKLGDEGSDRMNERPNWLRREGPYDDNEHIVGLKEDADLLMSELDKEVKPRCVISIVGMGGLGKTTIAQKLYNTSRVEDKFDCYAWVSVSNDYNIRDLLRRTIKSFKTPKTKEEFELLEKMEVGDLVSYLRDYLEERRYLVVVDDVWDKDAWKNLRRAFPDKKNGSRVIMTTRNKVVAEHCDEKTYVHELPFLKEEESWELFCKKAFPDNDRDGDIKSCCPPHLEGLARDMVSKCRGLPLAIVVLGGLLRRKHPDEWPQVKEHIWFHMRDDSVHVQPILALSFNNLPHHLKACFLYLGLFPEDFEINAERLCWLWVAEGFAKQGEVSFVESYLKELIDRSLIQVVERNWRRVITCRVHDLLRDLAIEKSKELNFLHIYDGRVYSKLAPNSRRLASHCGFQSFVSLDHSDLRLRTLLFFNLENESSEIEQLQFLCKKLRLLRVLDLHGLPFNRSQERGKTRLPDKIGKLIHLRFLKLLGTGINELSPSIGNLHALQTLELSRLSNPIQLPDEICKAKQLRHLIGVFKWPFRVDKMTNLETLKRVVVDDQMEFNPTDLINLAELHVRFVGKGEGKRFTLDSIGGLRSLQSFRLDVPYDETVWFPALQPLSQCQHLLQLRLIWGKPKLPTEVHQFPPNLKYLYLDATSLIEDPMPMLEKLPNLTILVLDGYCGDKLVCTAGGFPRLEILVLFYGWAGALEVEEGGMPVLHGLTLEDFDVPIPDRLRSIPSAPPLDPYEWPY